MTRASAVAAVVAAFTLLPAARAAAQQPTDPVALRAGWAVEAGLGGYPSGSLLHIGTSGLAWMVSMVGVVVGSDGTRCRVLPAAAADDR